MRTTLSIDDDVLVAVRERARRERRSAGAVLSELAREALVGQHREDPPLGPDRYGFQPLHRRGNRRLERTDRPAPRGRVRMMRALLDIKVLLALLDGDHVDHRRAHAWLDDEIDAGWASCAITQNGFVRIISQPRYPSPISPSEAIGLLSGPCAGDHHEFWPCDVSLLDAEVIDPSRLHGPRQVTDAYLLALATAHNGRFVTFDDSIPLSVVSGATERHLAVL